MFTASIKIKESQGIKRVKEPIRFGFPLAQGALKSAHKLTLKDQNEVLNADFDIASRWSDGSIKWLTVSAQLTIDMNTEKALILEKTTTQLTKPPIDVEVFSDHIKVNTGCNTFEISLQENIGLSRVSDQAFNQGTVLLGQHGAAFSQSIERYEIEQTINKQTLSITLYGSYQDAEGIKAVSFESSYTFWQENPTIRLKQTIHNPKAAIHPKGQWDLGDPGSFFFSDHSITIPAENDASALSIKCETELNWETVNRQPFSLFQASSGQKNWKSKNHVNRDNFIPHKFKGYKFTKDSHSSFSADTATPSLSYKSEGLSFSFSMPNFWQQFPKLISYQDKLISLSLFPKQYDDLFELQGGERKTHEIYFDFSSDRNRLDWCHKPLTIELDSGYVSRTNVVPWLPESQFASKLVDFINDKGLLSERNFFAKREMIDEFGWRNFGDIYADHESLQQVEDKTFISHYNNQYDPILGFARMYLQTGDCRWFELMNDLASHTVDIDIYNTVEDRAEYNLGLFWHTDHYLDAETCTHRTFSKHHTSVYQDHTGGGGPGDEHCYTAGLTLHHFLTGDAKSKETVLNLAKWFINLQEGSNLVLERVLQAKKKDLPLLKRVVKGDKIPKCRYPLTRGTSNYLCTMLDAYSLSGDESFILRAERIIKQTLHPKENIDLRSLNNIEASWSYTIVLQGLTKYLDVKANMEAYDEMYYYARDSLLSYTEWMMAHESPYLSNPDTLEFPNMTWVAQDLRKANVLFIASQYTEKRAEYIEKANYFYHYVLSTLKYEKEASYARILILLMQNQGPEACFDEAPPANHINMASAPTSYTDAPIHSVSSILWNLTKDIVSRMFKFSLSKEKAWLNLRK